MVRGGDKGDRHEGMWVKGWEVGGRDSEGVKGEA